MNQRRRNRSRDAAMLCRQLVERRNGRRVTQHHSDLTATGGACRLALGAGLGAHSSHFGRKNGKAEQLLPLHRFGLAVPRGAAIPADHDPFALGAGNDGVLQCGGNVGGRGELGTNHEGLQAGRIPAMSESYAVTSDVSTGISA